MFFVPLEVFTISRYCMQHAVSDDVSTRVSKDKNPRLAVKVWIAAAMGISIRRRTKYYVVRHGNDRRQSLVAAHKIYELEKNVAMQCNLPWQVCLTTTWMSDHFLYATFFPLLPLVRKRLFSTSSPVRAGIKQGAWEPDVKLCTVHCTVDPLSITRLAKMTLSASTRLNQAVRTSGSLDRFLKE